MTTKEEENRFDKVEVLEGYHFFIIFPLNSIKSSYCAAHIISKLFRFKNVEIKKIEAPGGKRSDGYFGNCIKACNNSIKVVVALKGQRIYLILGNFDTQPIELKTFIAYSIL